MNPMFLLTNQYTFVSFMITKRQKLQINKYKLYNQGLYKYCYQKSYWKKMHQSDTHGQPVVRKNK